MAAGELPVSDSGERFHPEHEENPRERRRFVLRALQNYTWATIFTLAHELGHYYQYLNRVSLTPRGIEWQATYYAHRVREAYYDAEWDEMDEWAEERADES